VPCLRCLSLVFFVVVVTDSLYSPRTGSSFTVLPFLSLCHMLCAFCSFLVLPIPLFFYCCELLIVRLPFPLLLV